MFKLFQNIISSNSKNLTHINEKSLETLPSENSKHLSHRQDRNSSTAQSELVWQQGNLREAIGLYDRAIQENPHSSEPYQQLFTHLKQQNNIAQAYKKLAASLKEQGKEEEAASCYRQAIVIQAVTKEAADKYQNNLLISQSARMPKIADLTNDAFSFQGTIKETRAELQPHLLQIELPEQYSPNLALASVTKNLNSPKIGSVEWEATQAFMQEALESYDRQQWSEVANACEQATSIMPTMAEAYKIWGNALQRMNHTAEAMKCYGKAIEIQPDLAEVYAGIAQLYAQQQKWQLAKEYYQKAIIIKPDFPHAYRRLAYVWEQSGQKENAEICYNRAKELESKRTNSPKDLDRNSGNSTPQIIDRASENSKNSIAQHLVKNEIATYQELGRDSEKQHLWHQAAVYYRKALELNLGQMRELASSDISVEDRQDNYTAQLANLKKIQKLIDSATEQEALSAIPGSTSQSLEDSSLNSTSDLERAIGNYAKQAALQPNSASIQLDLGDLYVKTKNWQLAIASYTKAIRINPKEAEAHKKLAKIFAKIGNHANYVDHMYLAYTLKSDLGSADDHFLLGEALRKLGNRTRAIACYEQAIKLQPHFNEAYRCLGRVLEESGKVKNAISAYQIAVRHNPYDIDFHFSLGQLQEQQESWDEAVKAYRKVLELKPKHPQASQRLNHTLSEKLKQDLAMKYKR